MIKHLNECNIEIIFGETISIEVNQKVVKTFKWLMQEKDNLQLETITPSYNRILVSHHMTAKTFNHFETALRSYISDDVASNPVPKKVYHVPVLYNGQDLDDLAKFHSLTKEKVIQLHTSPFYYIYMIGFTPGFPYLGGLDSQLVTPRKAIPRKIVNAGSVGIADQQTGIYSVDAPGGWQIIGKTLVSVYDINSHQCLFEAGHYIKFYQVDCEKDAMVYHVEEMRG